MESSAAHRRGRPRVDRIDTIERVAHLIADNPDISARAVAAELRIRKSEALRAVKVVRGLIERFPNSQKAA